MYLLFLWDPQAHKSEKNAKYHVFEVISYFYNLILD